MNNPSTFDVLVVYTQSNATSALSTNRTVKTPFSLSLGRENYSSAYSYFLEKCEELGLEAAFTTTEDIIGPGLCRSFWVYKNNKWQKKKKEAFAPLIFDKFSSIRKIYRTTGDLLFLNKIARPFNDQVLLKLFNDKLKTYKTLGAYTLPTVLVSKTTVPKSIALLRKLISNHSNPEDFTKSFILKDRYGAGGEEIYKIEKNPKESILKILLKKSDISFILQPFARFEKGYSHKNRKGFADIRIISAQGKIVQRYLRLAQKNNYKCNEHQGGKVVYVGSEAIPQNVQKAYSDIVSILNKANSLFALDFIVSDKGNAYLLEGNINPGIYWGKSFEDEVNTKELIKTIVKELKKRSDFSKTANISDSLISLPLSPILPQLI